MAIESNAGGTMITGDDVLAYRLLTMQKALKMEIRFPGMRMTRGRAVSVIIREATGLKSRKKTKLLSEFTAWLNARGVPAT